MSYDNTNRGQIWGNDKKEKDTHPDFKGSINVEGKEYWLSAWKRKPGANPKSPALSFSIQSKVQAQHERVGANAGHPSAPQPAPPNEFDLTNDDIPF